METITVKVGDIIILEKSNGMSVDGYSGYICKITTLVDDMIYIEMLNGPNVGTKGSIDGWNYKLYDEWDF